MGCEQNKVKRIIKNRTEGSLSVGKLIESSKEAKLKAEVQRNVIKHCFYKDAAQRE